MYRVTLDFMGRASKAITLKGVLASTQGTAFHIGNGYFLSSAHVFAWPDVPHSAQPINDRTSICKITLTSGSGNLDAKLNMSTHSFDATIYVFPDILRPHVVGGTGLLSKNIVIPIEHDVVLLKAQTDRWLRRLRDPSVRPYILPEIVPKIPGFTVVFVGVNGDDGRTEIYEPAATATEVEDAVKEALPDEISYAFGTGNRWRVSPAPNGLRNWTLDDTGPFIKHTVGCLEGSSCAPLLSTSMRLLGIEIAGDEDNVTLPNGKVEVKVSNRCRNIALTWGGTLSEFCRLYVVDLFDKRTQAEQYSAWMKVVNRKPQAELA